MRIFQVVAGIGQESGGPSYTIPSLCSHLRTLGTRGDVELNILSSKENIKKDYFFDIVVHKRRFPERLGMSSDMKKYLLANVKPGDILHTHGLWMMPNIYPLGVAKKVGAKLVLSPRGMLAKWSLNQSRMIKRLVGYYGQYRTILNSDCIHVTAENEYEDVRNFGYKGPIAIIPNGIDIPEKSIISKNKDKEIKKIIFISRIHPKKGIELLLEAWGNICHLHPAWELEICGPGDSSYIKKIKQDIENIPGGRVRYIPPVYDEKKDEFYNSASLFVLPTYSENFGVVVAEALSYCIPVIVSKGAPWQNVKDNKCGWWIDNNVAELTNTLNKSLQMSAEDLTDMGGNGRRWMEADFSWRTISTNIFSTYQWLNNMIEKPNFIRID